MPGKTDSAVVNQRIDAVFDMLIAGARRRDIIKYATENGWSLSDNSIDMYIKRANATLAKHSSFVRDEELGRAINRLNNLYMRSARVNDFRTALSIQRELSLLLGLHAPTKRELTGADSGPVQIEVKAEQLTDDELARIIASAGSEGTTKA